jgi:hypothetical protein
MIMVTVTLYSSILLFCLYRKILNIVLPFLLMVMSVWFSARCCNGIFIWYEVDILTVYFFVCQFISLIYQWIHQHLPYLSFTLHQRASSFYTAFLAYLVYDLLLRLIPTYFNFTFIWLAALIDV